MAQGLSQELPLTRIMSSPVISNDSGEPVFAVLVQMLRHHIHHVLITENAAPKAVITDDDLMHLKGKSSLDVARDIEQQTTIEGLQTAQARVRGLVSFLMREGEKASNIACVVAEINDRVVQKIVEFAVSTYAPRPVPFCWVALGSEGCREQTFLTDQDNALIYADIGNDDRRAAIESYFQAFTTVTGCSLEMCGYPSCTGGYTASNPRWRQPLCEWKRYFHTWIRDPTQERSKDALILFDMRPVAGNLHLYEELWQHDRQLLGDSGEFKSISALVSVKNRPPLGLFRTFVLERGGEHNHELDLKLSGTGPIVNAARVFALDALIQQTNTIDRLNALEALNGGDDALLHDMCEAFEFLTQAAYGASTRAGAARKARKQLHRPGNTYADGEILAEGCLPDRFARAESIGSQIRNCGLGATSLSRMTIVTHPKAPSWIT
jgi:CBS domain-containing protein